MDKNITQPKVRARASQPHQIHSPVSEVVESSTEIILQMENEGCPPATVTRFRDLFRLALRRTIAKSKRRDFLIRGIERSFEKLRPKRFMSGPPPGSAAALDEIEGFASQLPDSAEKRLVLKRIKQIRGCLPEGREI